MEKLNKKFLGHELETAVSAAKAEGRREMALELAEHFEGQAKGCSAQAERLIVNGWLEDADEPKIRWRTFLACASECRRRAGEGE